MTDLKAYYMQRATAGLANSCQKLHISYVPCLLRNSLSLLLEFLRFFSFFVFLRRSLRARKGCPCHPKPSLTQPPFPTFRFVLFSCFDRLHFPFFVRPRFCCFSCVLRQGRVLIWGRCRRGRSEIPHFCSKLQSFALVL